MFQQVFQNANDVNEYITLMSYRMNVKLKKDTQNLFQPKQLSRLRSMDIIPETLMETGSKSAGPWISKAFLCSHASEEKGINGYYTYNFQIYIDKTKYSTKQKQEWSTVQL